MNACLTLAWITAVTACLMVAYEIRKGRFE